MNNKNKNKNKNQNKHKKSSNRNNSNKSFTRRPSNPEPSTNLKINKITPSHVRKTAVINGLIDRVVQTSGPTIFYVYDGTGNLALKGFSSPGARAHPEISEGSVVKATVRIEEFRDELEGEILRIESLEGERKFQVEKEMQEIQRERAKVVPPKFLIQSPILEKLKPRFIKAATEIRLAVMQNRPIIVRHHNDADGYSSGFALERAILPLIEEQHGGGKSAWEFFTRAPSAAPFYEIDDSIRDTARSLSNVAKFSNKLPLVIIADNGSSPEDLMAIQQGKVHGIDFIVIDHHGFDEDVISKEVLVHINPFLVKEDGASFSAGMLSSEVARFINPNVKNIEQIPAMAGIADRIDLNNPQAVNDYIKIAERKGYSKQLLGDISNVIDFVSAKVRFMEVREYVEVLFGEPMDKQKKLVGLLAPYIYDLEKKGLEIAKANSKVEKLGKTNLQSINIDESFPGFGFYPKPGKAVGLLHDYGKEKKKLKSLVSIGIMNTAITIRATDEANFSVHDLIKQLNKKLPNAFVEGGGHKNAGSINFIPVKQKEVLSELKKFVKSRG